MNPYDEYGALNYIYPNVQEIYFLYLYSLAIYIRTISWN